MKNEKVLLTLRMYVDFLENLREMNEGAEEIPLAEGKWSSKQIIGHMYRWDLYLIETILPAAITYKSVHFPSHDEYNAHSELFAETVTFDALINQSVDVRKKLIEKLKGHQLLMENPITVNGHSH
jgi:hypothetical protein